MCSMRERTLRRCVPLAGHADPATTARCRVTRWCKLRWEAVEPRRQLHILSELRVCGLSLGAAAHAALPVRSLR